MTKYTILIALVVALAVVPAHANYMCSGPVTAVSFDNTGVVVFSGIGGISAGYLCSLSTTSNGITPDVCKAKYTQLLIAQLTGQSLNIYFGDNLTCTTQPSWNWLTGVYFGPGTI
jgi:hypothetical protein